MLFLNVWMEFLGTRVLRNGEVWAQDSFLYLYVGGWEFFFGFFNYKEINIDVKVYKYFIFKFIWKEKFIFVII